MVPADQEQTRSRLRPSQWGLAAFVVVGAVGSIAYRVIHDLRFEQTSALFIGLPALLAIGLALSPPPKTASGIVMKGITFFLLLSGALLAEGFICIIMAAPIFYFVGFLISVPIDWYIRRAKNRSPARNPSSQQGVEKPHRVSDVQEIHPLPPRSVYRQAEALRGPADKHVR